MLNYLPIHSKKKSYKVLKTQPNTTFKETNNTKEISYSKSPVQFRSNSPTNVDFAKKVPRSIIYDKQTLYIEVQQLKTELNKLRDQNMKLKTKIAIAEAEKERLNKSVEDCDYEERHGYRTFIPRQQSQRKLDNLKYTAMKKQVQDLRNENQALKKQNLRIKKKEKYLQINQLQVQMKVVMEENMRLLRKYDEIRIKLQARETSQKEQQKIQKQINLVQNQNKKYSLQIEQMHVQIMNLEAQLRKQRDYFISREKRLALQVSEAKRFDVAQGKNLHDFKKQNLAFKEAHIRSLKAEQRLQHTSFKSHYVHVQPIRRDKIFNVKIGRKLQWDRARIQFDQSKEKRVKSLLRSDDEKIKFQQSGKIEDEVILSNQTSKSIKQKGIVQKPSNVQTHFTDNLDKEHEKEENQINQSKHTLKNDKQTNIKQQLRIEKSKISSRNSLQHNQSEVSEKKINRLQQSQEIQQIKNTLKTKKYQSERNFQNIPIQEKEEKKEREQVGKSKSARSKLIKQSTQYTPNNSLLKEIKTLLTYRFINQKYTFSDLRKDIQSSSAKQYSFVDICYMLVNEPFYLNVDYCRESSRFIFDKQRPEHQSKVDTDKLILKLRKLLRDYEPIGSQMETQIIQKCVTVITANREKIESLIPKQKIQQDCIDIETFKLLFQSLQMNEKEIEYLIAQASLNSNDLQHLAYRVVLQRFNIDSDIESKHSVIFQRQDEDNSNLDRSNIGQQNENNEKKMNRQNSHASHQKQKMIEKSQSVNKIRQKQRDGGNDIIEDSEKKDNIYFSLTNQIKEDIQKKQIQSNIVPLSFQKLPSQVEQQIADSISHKIQQQIKEKKQQASMIKIQKKESQQKNIKKQFQQNNKQQNIQQNVLGKQSKQKSLKIQEQPRAQPLDSVNI